MTHDTLLRHLVQARQHIAEGRAHIAAQRTLIAQLEARGQDTTHARRTLVMLERMRAMHLADSARIEQALEQGGPPFSTTDDFRRAQNARAMTRGSLDELRWYHAQLAETAAVLQRSKESLDTSREILLQVEQLERSGDGTSNSPPER
jgi:tRNA A37 N6-isopentenylltransferase MiaA